MKDSMWNFLFSPTGRASRRDYWMRFVLPYVGIAIVAAILDVIVFGSAGIDGKGSGPFQAIVALFYFWPSLAVSIKRLHDRGLSGWWIGGQFIAIIAAAVVAYMYLSGARESGATPETPLGLIAVLGALVLVWFYVLIQMWFFRGQVGDNKYGPDPLGNSADVFK